MLAYKAPLALAPVTVVNKATGEVVKAPAPVRSISIGGSSLLSSPILWIVAGVILLVSLER